MTTDRIRKKNRSIQQMMRGRGVMITAVGWKKKSREVKKKKKNKRGMKERGAERKVVRKKMRTQKERGVDIIVCLVFTLVFLADFLPR